MFQVGHYCSSRSRAGAAVVLAALRDFLALVGLEVQVEQRELVALQERPVRQVRVAPVQSGAREGEVRLPETPSVQELPRGFASSILQKRGLLPLQPPMAQGFTLIQILWATKILSE